MGILSDFFVASPDQAIRYANSLEEPDEGEQIRALLQPFLYKGITSLEVGLLWAILEGVPWNVHKHMPETIEEGSTEESWLERFPNELTELLAQASPEQLSAASVPWATTAPMRWAPEELSEVLDALHGLARKAIDSHQAVYLWGCL